MRRRASASALALLVAGVGAGVLGSGCGSPAPLSGQSTAQVRSTAVAAAHQADSFHFIDRRGSGAAAVTLTGDASSHDGQQTLVGEGSRLDVRLIDGVAYIRAGADVLHGVLGLSVTASSTAAGKWISVTKSDKGFAAIVKSLAPTSVLGNYLPVGTLHRGPTRSIRGIATVPVSGDAPASPTAAGTNATATLYVEGAEPHVPVSGTLSGTDVHGRTLTEAAVFTAWGEPVRPKVPKGAVPASSLAHG